MTSTGDLNFIQKLNKREEEAYEILFRENFGSLVNYAQSFLFDLTESKDLVQSVFLKIWENPEVLKEVVSIKAYLLKMTRNLCLDNLRHKRVIHNYSKLKAKDGEEPYHNLTDPEKSLHRCREIRSILKETLDQIPEDSRKIFLMNRFTGMKYAEIANEMEISVKAVEYHMSKALAILRKSLADFLSILHPGLFLLLSTTYLL